MACENLEKNLNETRLISRILFQKIGVFELVRGVETGLEVLEEFRGANSSSSVDRQF